MSSGLYHCTSFENLKSILSSQKFYPSYCLEKATYWDEKQCFVFAMICFADLLDGEISSHMQRFRATTYLKMDKKWAMNNNINPVCYYTTKDSPMSAFVHRIIEQAMQEIKTKHRESEFTDVVNLLMAYLKQYEGRYWMDDKSEWSQDTIFYTEREWRYVPIVHGDASYCLSSDNFMNKQIRTQKRQELIDKEYVLKFSIFDVLEIGVSSEQEKCQLVDFLDEKQFSQEWCNKIQIVSL